MNYDIKVYCFPDFFSKIQEQKNSDETWQSIHDELKKEDWIIKGEKNIGTRNYPNRNQSYFIMKNENSLWLFSFKDIMKQEPKLRENLIGRVKELIHK